MESSNPEISIITINYNGYSHTCELIDSLKSNVLTVSYEIIVVDNGSTKNEALWLQRKYPEIIVIKNNQNMGFSGGNNAGIKLAMGRYILLLNNDTFIDEDNFKALIERLESDTTNGVVSPKIKFAFEPHNIQFAGYLQLSQVTLRNHMIGYNEIDNGQFDQAKQTPYTHGAAMMLKKEVIKKVGLMPEIYFLYYEELDWCTKIANAGYKLWYEPACTVFHKESESTGKQSPLKVFYLTRNRLLYAWRNRSGFVKWESILYQMSIATFKNCLSYIIKFEFNLLRAYLKGNIAFIRLKYKMI